MFLGKSHLELYLQVQLKRNLILKKKENLNKQDLRQELTNIIPSGKKVGGMLIMNHLPRGLQWKKAQLAKNSIKKCGI